MATHYQHYTAWFSRDTYDLLQHHLLWTRLAWLESGHRLKVRLNL